MLLRPLAAGRRPARRAAILIVVLALLALFAVVGLSFIFYADAEATSARIYREAQGQSQGPSAVVPPDGGEAANQFVGFLVYGAKDTGGDLLNGMRGHSLAELLYGWSGKAGVHTVPFDGAGLPAFQGETISTVSPPLSRDKVVNYTVISGQVVDGNWSGGQRAPGSPRVVGTNTYVGRNVGVTYPDATNFFLASLDPRTGEVLVPSFFRPGMFSDTTNALSPSGTAMTGTPERYSFLRPRPKENTGFPAVPQNPDNTYTGDVQNLVGGVGVQKNDSLWMDIGLPPFDWNGKKVKALVAPLVLDLDSRINLNAAGNKGTTGGKSFGGYGPWEINAATMLTGGEFDRVVSNRLGGTNARSQGGLTTRYFLPPPSGGQPQPLPDYAQVNWGMAAGAQMTVPTSGGGSLAGLPTYTNYDNNTTAAQAQNHPSLFSAAEWPAPTSLPSPYTFTTAGTYPHTDLKRLAARYAYKFDWYDQMYVGGSAQNTLRGKTFPPPPAPQFDATEAAHGLRMEFTTLSTGFAVPMAPPVVLDYANSQFQKAAPAGNGPDTGHPTATPPTAYPTAQAGGASATAGASDFDGTNKMWVNRLAALGGVDVNRKLTPFPTDTTTGLPTGNSYPALADRQNLACDIYARLVMATGAKAQVDPVTGDVTNKATPGTPEFEALRYLAQLAVNIVDHVDADDISSPFIWNYSNTAAHATPSEMTGRVAGAMPDDTNIRLSVVFGTEKPRVVLNEAYSDYTNDPDEDVDFAATPPKKPMKPLQVRFWVELLNPTAAPYKNATTKGPLGDGSVELVTALPPSDPSLSPYQILIFRDDDGAVMAELRKPENTAGSLGSLQPQITLDFSKTDAAGGKKLPPNVDTSGATPQAKYAVAAGNGFVVLAPKVKQAGNADIQKLNADPLAGFAGDAVRVTADPDTTKVDGGTQGGLTYLRTLPDKMTLTDPQYRAKMKHVVVLRRLANPYAEATTAGNPFNPYVTVDILNYVPSMDAVFAASDATEPRKSKDDDATAGYDPKTPNGQTNRRYAVGRTQPLAGSYVKDTPPPATGSYNAADHLIAQNASAPGGGEVNHTFGRHNGEDANDPQVGTAAAPLATPFDWLPHFDRPLSNSLELLMVSCRKPHELTQTFIPANQSNLTAAGVNPWEKAGGHLAHWIEGKDPTQAVSATNPTNGLYRALDMLRVAPWDLNTPLGGKVHGRINWNTVQDPRVFAAALDVGSSTSLASLDANATWGALAGNRTPKTQPATPPSGAAGTSYVAGQNDVPFQSAGAVQYTDGGTLRGLPQLLQRSTTGTTPNLWVTSATHPYLQSEAARKLWNNSTTVSNAFAVWVTVGFFEVATDANGNVQYTETTVGGGSPGRATLGKEAYKEVPGDLRQQYFAVIDRTNLTLDPTDPTKPGPVPFFTGLEDSAAAGATTIKVKVSTAAVGTSATVYADGQPIKIVPFPKPVTTPPSTDTTDVLFVGTGPAPGNALSLPTNRERVTVTGITAYDPTTGVATLTVSGLTYAHPAGALVTNVVPGNPGPQGAISDVTQPAYKPVVLSFTRLR